MCFEMLEKFLIRFLYLTYLTFFRNIPVTYSRNIIAESECFQRSKTLQLLYKNAWMIKREMLHRK